MQHLNCILVATDMSEQAAMAEARAAKLCKQFQTEHFEILNVQESAVYELFTELLKTTDDTVEEIVATALEINVAKLKEEYDVTAVSTVRTGRIVAEIIKRAAELDASVLVVGAHGNNLHTDLFVGNVTEKLLNTSECPVLIVRQKPEKPYHNILIPIDFSAECLDMAREALAFSRPASSITLLHAYEVPNEGLMRYASVDQNLISDFKVKAREKAETDMSRFTSILDRQNRLKSVIKFGPPLNVIHDYVNDYNPDLIVMGKRSSSRIEEMLLGSVSRHIINETSCDILIIPSRMLEEITVLD